MDSAAPRPPAMTPTKDTPRYIVRLDDADAHLFHVEVELDAPDPEGQEFWLPVWIPGSYLVREFSRHVFEVGASCRGRTVAVRKLAKNRWRAAPCRGPLRLRCAVWGRDASVRTAYLDRERAFFNPSSLLPAVAGRETLPQLLRIDAPADRPGWTLATTLEAVEVDDRGFGLYRAADYHDLVDHPAMAGDLLRLPLRIGGAAHEVVIDGAARLAGRIDARRLRDDLRRVGQQAVALFEPERPRPPFRRYAFLLTPTADGYGGLEHADCTALICAEDDLPHPRDRDRSDGYRRLLGLFSHEYFHAWHVKRITPAALTPPDLERENPTSLLWLFEGFTSYYDDLLLLRAGLLSPQQYLDVLARTVNAVQGTPGRRVQSLAESSVDAWIKFYRPDETTANATVSYYGLGALFALTLDLSLRARGSSLDAVMRLLWQRYGRADAPLRGVAEDAVPALLREATGVDLDALFERHVAGREDLPLRRLLAGAGVAWSHAEPDALDTLGLRLDDCGGWPAVRQVPSGSWAERCGLAAGDLLIAVEGRRASAALLRTLHARAAPGQTWRVHAMRDARLLELEAALPQPHVGAVRLTPAPRPSARALRLRRDWLGA